MKTKRILSALMSMVMVFTMFTVLTLTATVPASAATTTEKAIFIGSTTKTVACAFIPLDITVDSDTWYELSFKCKTLKNGNSNTQADKPSIGILGQHDSSNYYVETCPSWAGNYGSGGSTNDYNFHTSYSSGVYTMRFKLRSGSCNQSVSKYSDWGNRTFYLTIGNAAFRNPTGNTIAFQNLGASFIFSDISLYLCESESGSTSGDSLIPQINDSNVDFGGTYFFRKDNSADVDGPISATANKWHVMAMPDHVKYVTVPSDYNTSSNYNAANFSRTAETAYTREYYTNTNYTDLTFAKLANSNDAGYQVISDINKKMIVIDANHEGEADNRTTDGYKPVYNRPANIFIPLSLGQYNINTYGVTTDTSYLARISMKAVRLEGDGYPVLGRITPRDTDHSQALAKMAKNLHLSGYYSAGSHEQYTGGDYSYNETTGEFVGWIRVKGGDSTYRTKYGTSEIITIGNAEHVWADGTFDTTEFNSSFAISDIKVDLYSYTGSYTVDSLLYEDVALPLYAETIDTDTQWIYQCNGQSYSAHSRDVARASQTTWNAEGCVGMVHTKNLTACMRSNHSLTHHAATSTTREYYSCASCSKNFADPWGLEQVTDLTSTQQMALIAASGTGSESVFYPVKLNGFENNQWFKFTCKVKCFGDSYPVVSSLYANYDGKNQCETTVSSSNDGDFAFWESSYDPSTGILTGYMKAWIKNTINQGNRYSYERINPVSGANCAIVIGNGRYVGTGYTDASHTTGFAITEPTLYKVSGATTGGSSGLADAKTKSTTGDNLLKPITDKTVDFDSEYVATWTNGNNPLAAPVGKWYKTGSKKANVSAKDMYSGVFSGTPNKRTLRASGPTNVNNVIVASYETYIDSNTTYQFDLDYSVFGGAEPRILIQTANSDGYGADTQIYANDTVNGNHITYEFTTGTLRTNSANFRIQLGVDSSTQNKQTTVYFGNAMLRKKSGSVYGPNHLINGDFSLTPDSFNGVYSTAMTDDEIKATIPYWSPGNATDNSGVGAYTIGAVKGTRKYNNVTLLASSGYIFGNSDATGKSDIAVRMDGHASHGTQLQFFAGLKPSTTYRLVFNYRSNGDAPEVTAVSTKDAAENPIISKTGSFPRYGVFSAQYDITTGSDYTYSPNSNGNGNTRFLFKIGGYSQGKSLYISGVTLYELSGGNPIGNNIAGELNPILADGIYDSIIPNNGDAYPVLYSQDGDNNMNKFVAVGWYGVNQANDYSAANGAVVKVPSDFFTRTSYATRITNLSKAIIGKRTADTLNPDYDPNDDGVLNVKDLVHMKIKALNYEGVFDGAANATAQYMLENVIDVKNDSSGYVSGGNVWYVSTSGSDSNNGKSASAPFATLSKANSSASAGDTIYLKRGDTFRNTDLTADYAFTFKAGVNYAAYGSGNKPVLSGSAKNYASNSWYETSSGSHIWYTTYNSGTKSTNTNAAMIYFYDNKGNLSYGKSIAKKATDTTYSFSASDLNSDLEYFSPYKSGSNTLTLSGMTTQGRIYVYSTANPTTRFSRIEIATDHRAVVQAQSGTNNTNRITTANNIAVMYGGVHGVKGVSGGSNVILKKCEIAYIGGGFSHESSAGWSRLGNGVEFGDGYTNGRVYDSYIHDCYDAGLTFQSYGSSSSAYTFSYIYFERNVIERCTYNIEFFTKKSSDRMWNISFSNNVLRNAGYGWGSYDRCDDGWRISNICGSKNNYMNITTEGNGDKFKIKNNIFDCTRNAQVVWYWDLADGPAKHENMEISGNTYFQKKGNIGGVDSPRVMNYGGSNGSSNMKYAYSRDAFIDAVAAFDDNPMGVYWLDDNY